MPHRTSEPEPGGAHLDAERLLAAALGGDALDSADADHLRTCVRCQTDGQAVTTVAGLARVGRDATTLPAPPLRVWERIAAQTGVATGVPTAPRGVERPREVRRPMWWQRVGLAAAAALLGVAGTIGVGRLVSRTDEPDVTVQADLGAFGTAPATAHGSARVLAADGTTQLHIHVVDLPRTDGFYEVWLINPDTGQMISVGILGDESDVLLPLAGTVDLTQYRLVDVSAEPLDGDPAHSGDSLLRGTWTA